MTPVIPCSVSSISLVPGTAVTTRRNRCFARYNCHRKPTIQPLNSLRFFLTLPRTVRTCLQCRTECIKHHRSSVSKLLATGTDVAVEEQDLPAADEDSTGPREEPSAPVETTEDASPKPSASAGPSHSKQRQGRKSEMPPVKDEDLVPGATFTGKVRSILPFGAFVDFGAFTDGLVHVSQLSDNFVRDVGNVVSVGQEVKVKLVEVNTETGRISLSMRDLDGNSKLQQKKDDISSSEKSRPPRKNSSKPSQWKGEVKKSSKFVRGQDLMGTVKNITRSGAFINLPEGKEGFLPSSEEPDEGFGNVMGGSSLEIGQEVSIRVLRVTRGQVTLTMKREEDVQKLDSQLNQGVLYEATNPFVLAFRRNKDIAAFLDEREKLQETSESSEKLKAQEVEATTKQAETVSDILTEETLPAISDDSTVTISDAVNDAMDNEDGSQPRIEDAEINATEISSSDDNDQSTGPDASENLDGVVKTEGGETEAKSELLVPEAEASTEAQTMEEPSTTVGPEGDGKKLEISGITTEQISSSEAVASEQIVANDATAEDEVKITNPVVFNPDDNNVVDGEEVAVTAQAEAAVAGDEVQTPISTTDENIDVLPAEDGDTPTDLTPASGELSEGQIDDFSLKDEEPVQQVAVEDQSYSPAPVENENGISTPEKDESLGDSNVPISSTSTEESAPKAAISPALVKQLREETGAGMMDCKKALSETGGDIVKAQEYLRKKGLASADKKASRVTAEGRIGSYIHDSRIGVLIEVNCETDFVSWGEIFKALVDDLAMQVAACPQVEYLSTDDVPKEIVEKETEIEMQKEDLLSKPEQIRSKIVEGRVKKRLGDLALLEQAYIKDDKVVVKDWVKQTIATIGENIKVKRFVRYNLGEGLEKKNQDFAAEVAAQTAIKSEPVPSKEQPAEAETDKPVEKTPAVAVSAALVKQLREETGAGMMDCKKALSETGGDLKKAQEYLRKKGLSTADKKSSRLAAEGRIGSYIHDSQIGVLIEVNCETDFVGRSEKFKELVDDLAMQAVACPQVEFVSIEDIPESVVSKEKEIEMQREDILSKPENIREKIVAGRVSKRLGELTLLEQPFIKDDTILVKDLVKQTVAALGENIKVRRFIRFTLGEQTENVESKTEA